MSRDYALSYNPKGAEKSSISAVRAKIEGSSADLPIESDQHSNERRHQHAHDHFADGLRNSYSGLSVESDLFCGGRTWPHECHVSLGFRESR